MLFSWAEDRKFLTGYGFLSFARDMGKLLVKI